MMTIKEALIAAEKVRRCTYMGPYYCSITGCDACIWEYNDDEASEALIAISEAFERVREHGHWVYWRENGDEEYATIECSVCGATFDEQIIPFDYCPNCGAEMDGG